MIGRAGDRLGGARGLVVVLLALLAGSADAAAQDVVGPEDLPPTSGVRPVPVVLVPGWSDGGSQLAPLKARLVEEGWPPGRVAIVDFEDPFGSNREHAGEVAREIEVLRTATGEARVDVVAHSMGGLAVRYHLLRSEGTNVRRIVFLATPHRGTVAAHVAWGRGSDEMEPGSPFLDSLNAGPPVPDGVAALNVRTPLDLRVLPQANAALPTGAADVREVEVCCPTHPGMLDDPEVFREIVAFLRSEERAK